jgi:hypothetical protein
VEKVLADYNGEEIKINDIVARENLKTGEMVYFLYQEEGTKNGGVLYKYDKSGNIDKKSIMSNIYMGEGVDLISNYDKRWVRIGNKEEVYDKIFNK